MSSKDHKIYNEQVSKEKECEDVLKNKIKEHEIMENSELTDSHSSDSHSSDSHSSDSHSSDSHSSDSHSSDSHSSDSHSSDSMNKEIIDNRITELQEQISKMKKNEREILLRAKADIENIRKRTEQDIEKAHKFALEKFANELLPVIDNLERAIELIDRDQSKNISMREGIQLTLKSFLTVINKFGIEVIQDKYISFNPDLHQAVTTIESDQHEPNQVIDIMQKGYILNGRLLRPAMVVVAKSIK